MPGADTGEPTDREKAEDALDPVLERLKTQLRNRWGHAWLDSEPSRVVNIGVREPTSDDALRIMGATQIVGWQARIIALRYSAQELEAFHDRVREIVQRPGRRFIPSSGPDAKLNKVQVVLREADGHLIEELMGSIPRDALAISVQPDFGVFPFADDHLGAP